MAIRKKVLDDCVKTLMNKGYSAYNANEIVTAEADKITKELKKRIDTFGYKNED